VKHWIRRTTWVKSPEFAAVIFLKWRTVPGSRSGGSCSCPGCREEIMTKTKQSKYRKWGKRRRHQAGSRNQKEVNKFKGS
jgi:hypothetical protein